MTLITSAGLNRQTIRARGRASCGSGGWIEEIVGAVLSHADWNWDQYPLDRPLRKSLFAVDELCGFITAVAYVRPEKLAGMAASSVRKKMKQKSFAAAVKREDIERGAQLLNVTLDEHIQGVIGAMQGIAKEFGLAPAQS